jgi:cytochrome c oxidase subunit 2
MAIAIVVLLLVLGSVVFHIWSPWYFTPIASNWTAMDDTIALTFWVTGAVFVVVNVFMVYCVIRYRQRKGSKADYEPESKKLEAWLVGLTTVGVAAMLAPGLSVWADFVNVPKDAAIVEAVGQQWYWSYRLPGKDGKLGAANARHVNDKNPLGIDPDDPNGKDDVVVANPELHLPVGKTVKLLLRSKDVLHNFTVAEMRVKMDLVPGLVSYIWFTPTRTGNFDILCEELCGIAHFAMRGKLIVEEESAYRAWLSAQSTFGETMTQTAGDPDAGKALYTVCATCHGTEAEGNPALNAPKLTGLGNWYLQRQLKYFKTGVRGTHEKDVFGKTMAPMAATLVDDAAIANVSAYIETLTNKPAPVTVKGDPDGGKRRYTTTCAACHGREGQGIQALNAPGLKGMSDWYMVTQLNNFKQGIRGAHPKDMYGLQMTLMSKILSEKEAVNDIVSYVSTLQ